MAPNDTRTADTSGITIVLGEGSVTSTLFGINDENLRLVEDAFGVRISARGSELFIRGDESNSRSAGKVLAEQSNLKRVAEGKWVSVTTSVPSNGQTMKTSSLAEPGVADASPEATGANRVAWAAPAR